MSQTVREKLEAGPMYDAAVVEHRFTPYMRDYDIIVDVPAATPDGGRSFVAARCLYRFTHCVIAHVATSVADETWRVSWGDEYIDYAAWEASAAPDGYVWGVCWSAACPGLRYVEGSGLAREWSERLAHPMHEVTIGTNSHNFRLVFHDVLIKEIAVGDPETNELRPV